jgi:SAM-dependent methyltransferase
MAQQTSGLKSVLSLPWAYDALQNLLGVASMRKQLIAQHFALFPGARVLDVGCGTGELYAQLPKDIHYVGIDLSAPYIEQARARFGTSAEFVCADLSAVDFGRFAEFDRVIGTGILHHLDDAEVSRLMAAAQACLVPGGRLITVDPTLLEGQSAIARAVIVRDRGRNVRAPEGYAALAREHFAHAAFKIRTDLLRIPYTHCVLECAK